MAGRNAAKRRNRKPVSGGKDTAPVAKANKPTVQMDSRLRQSGTDRLAHIEDISAFSTGDVVLSEQIEPSRFERLGRLAGIFQRIKYNKLVFEIRSQTPTSTSGGYVVAFVRDPTDRIVGGDKGLNQLSAQAGSQTLNWWQSTKISVTGDKSVFFTSHPLAGDVRDFSPGRIIILCDGKTAGAGSLTITCNWQVELTEASLEDDIEEPERLVDMKYSYRLWTKDHSTGYTVALINGDKTYTTIHQLGVPANTYWRSDRAISLLLPNDSSEGYPAVLTTNYWCCWDQPETGSIRPCFIDQDGRLLDCNTAPGSWWYPDGYGPIWPGDLSAVVVGDTWVEVGVDTKPLNTTLKWHLRANPEHAARILALDGTPYPLFYRGSAPKPAPATLRLADKRAYWDRDRIAAEVQRLKRIKRTKRVETALDTEDPKLSSSEGTRVKRDTSEGGEEDKTPTSTSYGSVGIPVGVSYPQIFYND